VRQLKARRFFRGVLVLCGVALGLAIARALWLRGEWSAVVAIFDGVVLGYALLFWGLSWVLPRRAGLFGVVGWTLLGPAPVALYTVLHCLKLLRES
jgi:hypothetical protein